MSEKIITPQNRIRNSKGHFCIEHGLSKTTEHTIWCGMISRCMSTSNPAYKDYGNRGISVCDRWLVFLSFLDDIGLRPTPKHTLERHDNNKGYSPCNTYWANKTIQANNRRSNKRITYKGETLTQAQWAKRLGGCIHIVGVRIRDCGWSEEKAVSTPIRGHKQYEKSKEKKHV